MSELDELVVQVGGRQNLAHLPLGALLILRRRLDLTTAAWLVGTVRCLNVRVHILLIVLIDVLLDLFIDLAGGLLAFLVALLIDLSLLARAIIQMLHGPAVGVWTLLDLDFGRARLLSEHSRVHLVFDLIKVLALQVLVVTILDLADRAAQQQVHLADLRPF